VLALGLRLARLGRPPLWVDEATTLGYAARLPWDALFGAFAWLEPTPPSYYALVKLWLGLGLVPASEAGLRLPSALCGAAAVVPLFLFCRAAFGTPAALAGALLLALSAQHLHYSQQARVYALLFLVFACGLLAAQRLLRRVTAQAGAAGRRRRWLLPVAALAGLTAALIGLHGTGVFAAGSLYAYALAALAAAERRLSPGAVLPFLAAGAAGLVLGAPALLLAADVAAAGDIAVAWIARPSPDYAAWVVRRLLLAPFLDPLATPLGPAAMVAGALSLGAVLLGALAACRWLPQRRSRAEAIGLLAALGATLLGFYAVSQARPILLERTLLFTLALTTPLLGAGLAAVWRGGGGGGGRRRRPWLAAALAAAALAPQLPGLVSQYARRSHGGEDWRAAAAHIVDAAAPHEAVLVLGHFETVGMEFYLARAGGAGLPVRPVLGAERDPLAAATVEHLTRAGAAGAVRDGMGAAALCAALPEGAAGLWVVSRPDGVYPGFRRGVAAMLREAGGATLLAERVFDALPAQHWSAPARCAAS
jgi:hypothetical protein